MASKNKYHIAMHPQTKRDICRAFMDRYQNANELDMYLGGAKVFGVEVKLDCDMEPAGLIGQWVPPKDPFVIYEPKDESWCRYFGIGTIISKTVVPMDIRVSVPILELDPGANSLVFARMGTVSAIDTYPYMANTFEDRDLFVAQRAVQWLTEGLTDYYEGRRHG